MSGGDDVTVRPAAVADAAGIARVHVLTWQHHYRGVVPDAHLDGMSIERSSGKWEQSLANPGTNEFIVVAERLGEIIGIAKGGPERAGDPVYRGELHLIYILPASQRLGVGRKLVQAVAHGLWRRHFRSMLVWVLSDNPSRRFYESLGGEQLREQPIEIGGAMLMEVAYGWRDIAQAFGKPPRGPVVVCPYDPRWPAMFETIRARVAGAVRELAARIEHVGSTSVPGVAAKPVIDIDVLLRDPADLEEAIHRLAAIGYELEGEKGIPTRHAFRACFNGPDHHLYVCTTPDGEFRRHLALRDYLRSHPSEGAAYGSLKQQLAERFPGDIDGYMNGKDALVKELLRRAMAS